jgi:hypothetical protein
LAGAAGDTTLGVASVLLLPGALEHDELLFVLFGRPEFGGLAAVPLPDLVVLGMPSLPVAPFT